MNQSIEIKTTSKAKDKAAPCVRCCTGAGGEIPWAERGQYGKLPLKIPEMGNLMMESSFKKKYHEILPYNSRYMNVLKQGFVC